MTADLSSSGDRWTIYRCPWQECPPVLADHIISDPPFTDHVSRNAAQRVGLASRQGQRITDPTAIGLSFGGVDPSLIGPALVDAVRRWVVLFCAIEQVGQYEAASPEAYVRGGWWAKTNATPQFTGDRPSAPGEAIAILHHPGRRKQWNGGGHKAEWRGPSSRAVNATPFDERVHETQKPLWLMLELVKAFTDPGDLVWDPYMGSGTTGVACILTGRRFVGHEVQDRYFRAAEERLRAASKGQSLREYRAGQVPLFSSSEKVGE